MSWTQVNPKVFRLFGNRVRCGFNSGRTDGHRPSEPFQNGTGFYELFGVITHKGRDADSGHYVAWVKEKEGTRLPTWYPCSISSPVLVLRPVALLR